MINLKNIPGLGLEVQESPLEVTPQADSPPMTSTQKTGRVDLEVDGDFWTKLCKFMRLVLPIAA